MKFEKQHKMKFTKIINEPNFKYFLYTLIALLGLHYFVWNNKSKTNLWKIFPINNSLSKKWSTFLKSLQRLNKNLPTLWTNLIIPNISIHILGANTPTFIKYLIRCLITLQKVHFLFQHARRGHLDLPRHHDLPLHHFRNPRFPDAETYLACIIFSDVFVFI